MQNALNTHDAGSRVHEMHDRIAMETYFAPAKLNLFLHVTGRRDDGYHLLESVFQLLDFGDTVHLAVRADGVIRRVNTVSGVPEEIDLAVRAANLLKAATGSAFGVNIAINKRIPLGGGLGGGSSDAAAVLLALNRLWHLGLTRERLMQIGLKLGADVPFFIFGQNAFATGAGEQLQALDLPRRVYVVLQPQAMVPTAQIFRSPELTRNAKSVKITDFSADAWVFAKPQFRNDLEAVAKEQFPAVEQALKWLARHDANAVIKARMTGSGACVFAGFDAPDAAEFVFRQRPAGIGGFVAQGLNRHPLADFAV